ncbi:MAG TPA: response regulator transcription factor [Bryobacteraceae bacterium]|nr:response regulator transcription factor [Bryobacteraceae bacterium]
MAIPRVLLADDHKIVAQGIESLLRDSYDFVGTVNDGRALLDAAIRLKPDVVVTDISMPLLNGLDAVRQFKSSGVEAKVVFLTMHADAGLAAEAFRAGGSAFLLKESVGEELEQAISEILLGRAYLTPLIAKDMISVLIEAKEAPRDESRLTPRQREVLQLIAEGKTLKEVAGILDISARTVETHKYEMMQALGAKTNAELIQHAIRLHLVNTK